MSDEIINITDPKLESMSIGKDGNGDVSMQVEMTASKVENAPNCIFIRKVESKGEMIAAEPPPFIVVPVGDKIKLPDADEQLKGFYHERASEIIREMPKSYKRFEKKGAK